MAIAPNMSVLTDNVENLDLYVRKANRVKTNVGFSMKIVPKLSGPKFRSSLKRTHWAKLPNLCIYKIKYKTSSWKLCRKFSLNMKSLRYGQRHTVTIYKQWSSLRYWWTRITSSWQVTTWQAWCPSFWIRIRRKYKHQWLLRRSCKCLGPKLIV